MAFNTNKKILTAALPTETPAAARDLFIKSSMLYIGDSVARICAIDSTNPTTAVNVTLSIWGYSKQADSWVHSGDVTINSTRGGSADVTALVASFDRIYVSGSRANTHWYLAISAKRIGV